MTKALLIKSTASTKENPQGNWHKFEQASPFIQGIEAGDITQNIDSETLSAMISGLPSIWSRALMFAYAFKYTSEDANIKTSGLINFYKQLIAEYKGMLALMALYPNRISVSEPIYLNQTNNNIYDISSSFGDMLFEDVDLWCDPFELSSTKDEKPFIQIIKYNDSVIGATSPHTLFFTAVNYSLPNSNEIPWYRNGKFADPLEYGQLSTDSLRKIALLVGNIIEKLPDYEKNINQNRNGKDALEVQSLFIFFKNWLEEIKNFDKNIDLDGVLDAGLNFAKPFYPLFNIKKDLYYNNGQFSFNEDFGGITVDINKLLLQGDNIFTFGTNQDDEIWDDAAVYYLSAIDNNDPTKKWYFPVPLSDYGLKIFKNKIGDLLKPSSNNAHEIFAAITPKDFNLMVELYIVADGKRLTPIKKEYKIKTLSGAMRNVIMWPNFISCNWNAYYLYNEYPSNCPDVKFVPFYRNYLQDSGYESGEFIQDNKGNLIYANEQCDNSDINAYRIVEYPVSYATNNDFTYEIFKSNKPFAGLEIRSLLNGKDIVCGYILVKNTKSNIQSANTIIDLSHEYFEENITVGIDFGSNNSCVSYSKANNPEVKPINFKNHRVYLLGFEKHDPKREKTADRNELLFFQNDEQINGQIKSWVHDHDRRYVLDGMRGEEIAGGVPIFESNLIIHQMDERTITTNAGTLHHSMKWLTDQEGSKKKEAFLKSIWMAVVADLYQQKMIPSNLSWSYPGSFSNYDKLQYQQMYNALGKIPVAMHTVNVSDTPDTEAEAVCNYALNNLSISSNNIMLGIDVGGSTSDILIVSMDRVSRSYKMNIQSSLRMAAGMFISSAAKNENFRRAVLSYHQSPECKFKVANIDKIVNDASTAPFYINAVLDRIENENFAGFYSHISRSCAEIFAVPAYICGALLYYSGQLIRKTIEDNGYTQVNTVDLLPFGKGGRLFDWLDVFPGKSMANQYFNDCFKAGYGKDCNITLEKSNNIRKDNKSEVSFGLTAPKRVVMDPEVKKGSDIIGEEGYKFFPQGSNTPQELHSNDMVDSKYLEEMDFGIEFPQNFEKFEEFLKIFCDFVGPNKTGILKNSAQIENAAKDLGRTIKSFIVNDEQWQKADNQRKQGEIFDYKHSLFILECMAFMDKIM